LIGCSSERVFTSKMGIGDAETHGSTFEAALPGGGQT
jgi:hypothetical protein